MFICVTSRTGLAERLGAGADVEILPRLDTYVDLASMMRPMRLVMLDDDDSMRVFGLAATFDRQPFTVREIIRHIRTRLEGEGESLDGVFIIGGDEVIPFWRFANPVVDRLLDPDPIVLSDNPYGLADGLEPLSPDVAVGRLCDGGSMESLRRVLETMIATLSRPPLRTGSLAAVNEA